ncbi:hypothetical protein PZQ55_002676 [Clostridium botulinum]|nr:hypothetical protein [Clostridium botulinum]EKO2043645.1 hypothetical protein [Clostridium botulinum]
MNIILKNIIEFLKDKIVETLALLISLINLYLYYRTIKNEKVNLQIEQDNEDAYSFTFTWYKKYDCVFFHVSINNTSKSDTSISKITLTDNLGNIYTPSQYDIGDYHNDDGLSLYEKNDSGIYYAYNLKSDNLLNELRVPSFGHISGYLVFMNFPPISESTIVKLTLHTPTEIFSENIAISPLPDNITPDYN